MKWYKKLGLVVVVTAVLTVGAGIASAQEPPRGRVRVGAEALIAALADLTGLAPRDLLTDLTPETTLADIAARHDIAAADIVAPAAERIRTAIEENVANGRMEQAEADRILETLEADLTDLMDRPLPAPQASQGSIRQAGERALFSAMMDLTGLNLAELQAQAREQGLTTLSAIVEANGVSTADVIAAAIVNATDAAHQAVAEGHMSQEQADRVIASLEEAFTNAMQHPLPRLQPQQDPAANIGRLILQTAAELTGQEPAALLQQMRDGTPLADILTANGIDPNTVVDTVVSQVTERLEQQVRDFLNRAPTEPALQAQPAQ